MRAEVVEQIVIAAADTRFKTDRDIKTFADQLFRVWSSWLTASPLVWFILATTSIVAAAAFAWHSPQGNSNSRLTLAGMAAAFVSLFVVGMPAMLRTQHLGSNQVRVDAIARVFESHRVTLAEWETAKATIRQRDADFLGYGVARRFDTLCLP